MSETTSYTKTFHRSSAIHVSELYADLEVVEGAADLGDITVRVTGPRERVEAIAVTTTRDNGFRVSERPASGISMRNNAVGGVYVSGGGGSVSIATSRGGRVGQIVVNGVDVTAQVKADGAGEEPPTVVRITVPKGWIPAMDIGVNGRAEIGVACNLKLCAAGVAQVACGDAADAKVDASGTATVDIRSVYGAVNIDASGCSRVDIRGGQAGPLHVDASGVAKVAFGGVATAADLDASGCAGITVAKAERVVRQDRSGCAFITVRETGRR